MPDSPLDAIRQRLAEAGRGFVALDGKVWETHYHDDIIYLLARLEKAEAVCVAVSNAYIAIIPWEQSWKEIHNALTTWQQAKGEG